MHLADATDEVADAIVARINAGDVRAASELIEAERNYIERLTRTISGKDFPGLRNQAWQTSAVNSVVTDLLTALTEYAQVRAVSVATGNVAVPLPSSPGTRRKPLIATLVDRLQFRAVIVTAVRRHLNRLEYGRMRAANVFRPIGGRRIEDMPAADDGHDSAEDADGILGVVSTLCSTDQQLLRWYYVDGLKQHEIAARLGIHQSVVSKRLEAARETLRRAVEGDGEGTGADGPAPPST